jgi:hypothetical protein
MQGILFDFGTHTRHTENEMVLEPSHIAQKYLAAHVALVPTEVTFDCISGDYNAMALRTHNPPLKMYSKLGKVHVPTFVELCKNISPDKKLNTPAYSRFQDSLYPKPDQVETWQWLERPDQWKHAGAFIAMTLNPSTKYGELMDALDSDRHALRKYLASQSEQEKVLIAEDVGKLISTIKLAKDFYLNGTFITTPCIASAPQGQEEREMVPLTRKTETSLAALRPNMEDFRIRAGLSKTISTKRLGQQMLLSALQIKSEHVPRSILGRHQTQLPALETETEKDTATQLIDAFKLHEHESFNAKKSTLCNALCKATMTSNWDACTMLQSIVYPEKYIENARHCATFQKLAQDADKGEGRNDAELVRLIENV